MKTNLASLSQEEKDKIRVDLIAASVAFKERHNIPVVAKKVEYEQPTHLQRWFRERLSAHRLSSSNLSLSSLSPVSNKNNGFDITKMIT